MINRNDIFELTYYELSLIRNITAWYSLLLNEPVFQENKIYTFKIHLFSFSNTKQTNHGIFSNMTGENFNLAKIFWNVRVRLNSQAYLPHTSFNF